MTEHLLTARQLGDYLGLSAATILDRFEAGDLPGFRLFGRKGGPVRFRLSEIEAALSGWHVNGPGTAGSVSPTPTANPAQGVVSHASPTPLPAGGGTEDAS